jgi:DNA-directed RNA polymerase specialized sigma24 family protein
MSRQRRGQAARALALTGLRETPLVWLRRRKDRGGQPLISEAQFAAGERLAGDFWHAQMMPRVTADWSGVAANRRMRRSAPGAGVELSGHMLAARERIHRALAEVGPELAGVLIDVCCRDIGLEEAGAGRGWPPRAAKVVLQLALTRLARHYGLIGAEPAPGGALRHWGAEDFKPGLETWRD